MSPEGLRIVLDTGVLISRLLRPNSVPSDAVRMAFQRGVVLVSHETLAELQDVLSRPKFAQYLNAADVAIFVASLAGTAEIVHITAVVAMCRDPDDDKFLSLAQSGGAHVIITGDADLLSLDPFGDIRVISPRAFLDGIPVEPCPALRG